MTDEPQIDIGGVRTYDDLGLVLASVKDAAPEPSTSYVEVPGRDGALDLSEASGRLAYQDRQDEYVFRVSPDRASTWAGVAAWRSVVANALDGVEADYTLSWEPGWTRHGRWTVPEWSMAWHWRDEVTLKVRANPYRSRGEVVVRVNGAGGVRFALQSGRREVRPRVEVYHDTVLSVDGRSWELSPGTWVVDDLWLHQGDNAIAIDTTPEYSVAALSDYSDDALSAHAGSMLAGLAAGSKPLQTFKALSDLASQTLWDLESERLIDITNPASTDNPEYNAYFAYDWRDL